MKEWIVEVDAVSLVEDDFLEKCEAAVVALPLPASVEYRDITLHATTARMEVT